MPEMKRFLTYRFVAMLGWIVLLGAGFVLYVAVTSHIEIASLRWLTNLATLFGSIKLGLMLQSRVLAHVDPDGRLRAQVAKTGADAEH